MHPIAQARQDAFDAAIEFGTRLGRKFEATDVAANKWLLRVATDYAEAADETFGFMADMRQAAGSRWGLSNAQAKGVLNTLMARQTPRAPKGGAEAGPALPNAKDVPSGRFRVSLADGASTAIRLDSAAWAQDKPKGTRCIAIRTAEGWTNLGFVEINGEIKLWARGRPHLARLAPALLTVAEGVSDGTWLIYALSYAQEGRECSFCGLDLDAPESLKVGYGETCAKKRGLPWGAKAEPLAVALARLEAQRQAKAKGGQPIAQPVVADPAPGTPGTPEPPARTKRTYDEIFGPDEDLFGPEPPAPAAEPPAKPGGLLDLARQIERGRSAA